MTERRAMPGRSPGQPSGGPRDARGLEGMSRAQARALARSAPLTPAEFKARRRAAEEGVVSLRALLEDGSDMATEDDPGSA